MAESKRSIFRASAYDRFLKSREKQVLPRFVRPRAFVVVWVLLALLVAAAGLAWTARVPELASGSAVVVRWDGREPLAGASLALVVLLPGDARPALSAGQLLRVPIDDGGVKGTRPLAAVGPDLLGPDEVRQRYGLEGAAAAVARGPTAIALARFEAPDGDAEAWVGSVLPADVRVGERRVIALLPWIGRWFEEEA